MAIPGALNPLAHSWEDGGSLGSRNLPRVTEGVKAGARLRSRAVDSRQPFRHLALELPQECLPTFDWPSV